MHKMSAHLVNQAQRLIEKQNESGEVLTLNQRKAIDRINRIALSIEMPSEEILPPPSMDLTDKELREKIRTTELDADHEFYSYLKNKSEQKLSKISPESLLGYVNLLD